MAGVGFEASPFLVEKGNRKENRLENRSFGGGRVFQW